MKKKSLPALQRYTSAKTSLNQVAATFSRAVLNPGTVNLDYGGGKYNTATQFLKEQGVVNLVYDPFNRSAPHNFLIRHLVAKQKGADSVTVNNVLNVIKEKEALQEVIQQAANSLKPNGRAFFLIHEGDRQGKGRETTHGWQRNEKAKNYLFSIQKVFDIVETSGNLITALGPKPSLSSLFQEDQVMKDLDRALKQAGVPGRSSRFGVGKTMGEHLYVHRSSQHVIPKDILEPALHCFGRYLAEYDIEDHYTILKWNTKTGAISFIDSPNFDSEDEPMVGNAYRISTDGRVTFTPSKKDPQIYHHKWTMVSADYPGFSVMESQLRSLDWFSLPNVDKSRIGTQSFWKKTLEAYGSFSVPPQKNPHLEKRLNP